MNRLKEKYNNEIMPHLKETFKYKSVLEVPRLEKIIINMGVGDATNNSKLLDAAMSDLEAIAGQKPVKTYAIFSPSGKKAHMRKSTLDYLLLAQGQAISFGERDKVVTVLLEDIPAQFIKGHKKSGERYFGIKADLSNKPGETHFKWFFADAMTAQMCEEFITEHKFEESEEEPEEDEEDEVEEKEE